MLGDLLPAAASFHNITLSVYDAAKTKTCPSCFARVPLPHVQQTEQQLMFVCILALATYTAYTVFSLLASVGY